MCVCMCVCVLACNWVLSFVRICVQEDVYAICVLWCVAYIVSLYKCACVCTCVRVYVLSVFCIRSLCACARVLVYFMREHVTCMVSTSLRVHTCMVCVYECFVVRMCACPCEFVRVCTHVLCVCCANACVACVSCALRASLYEHMPPRCLSWVRVCVHMCACTCVYVCVCWFLCVCVCVCVCVCEGICKVHACKCMSKMCMRVVCMCVCVCVCVCVCACVCVYIFLCCGLRLETNAHLWFAWDWCCPPSTVFSPTACASSSSWTPHARRPAPGSCTRRSRWCGPLFSGPSGRTAKSGWPAYFAGTWKSGWWAWDARGKRVRSEAVFLGGDAVIVCRVCTLVAMVTDCCLLGRRGEGGEEGKEV